MKEWELAYKDYKDGMKYKDIASKYNKSINTVKSWKSRYWNDMTEADDKGAANGKKKRAYTDEVAYKEEMPKAVIELSKNNDLTEQQKSFCLYYLQSFNATQSYMKSHKVTYDTANAHGYKLLSNVVIKEELRKLRQYLQAEQYFTIQDIINEYAKQAFSDIKDITTFGTETVEMEDGTEREFSYVRLKDDAEVDGSLIQEIKQGKDGVSAKLYDKQKALEMLLKYMTVDDIAMAKAKLTEAQAKADIIKHTADKLVLDNDKQSQVLDLIEIGKQVMGEEQ